MQWFHEFPNKSQWFHSHLIIDATAITDGFGRVPQVKANFCVEGEETTAGSNVLGRWRPPFSAAPVEALAGAGAVLTGRTNMDEFGMGSANVFSRYGPVVNPWSPPRDPAAPLQEAAGGGGDGGAGPGAEAAPPFRFLAATDLSAGGSSGGAAAAVAAGATFAGLGSDTGGSVRQPAAWCGAVGLKPSYGRVSRHGLVAYASSLDCPGVIVRSVGDAALLLDALAPTAPDERDANSAAAPPYLAGSAAAAAAAGAAADLRGVVVGVPREFHVEGMDGAMLAQWAATVGVLQGLGAEVVSVGLPSVPSALPAYCVLACAEASSNLARFDGLRWGSNPRPKPRSAAATAATGYARRLGCRLCRKPFGRWGVGG